MIKKQDGKWCLFTKDGSRKLGCHDTEAEAKAQERAINASKHARALHAHASGLIRTARFREREYTVVPVIALVEGVIHAHNAPSPELVLAEEFGRAPQGWNGRPVMYGHPSRNGQQVSANEPAILEEGMIGHVFHSRIEDGKLKAEAWLDPELIEKVGARRMFDAIRAGEQVEVSVGVFVTEDGTHGALHGKAYHGIWKDITPDHLAFLTDGTVGACSIEMGCGAPRSAGGDMRRRHAGGPGSGNFGHAGRPGEVGGSAPSGGGGKGEGKGPSGVSAGRPTGGPGGHPLKPQELTTRDEDAFDRASDANISTGYTPAGGATNLQIYYTEDSTIVVPEGEAQNAEPWKFDGRVSPEDVLDEYQNEVGLEDEAVERTPSDMKEISKITGDWQKTRGQLDRLERGRTKDPAAHGAKRQKLFDRLKEIEDKAVEHGVYFDQNNSKSPAYDDQTGDKIKGLESGMTLRERFMALLEGWRPGGLADAAGADYGESDQEVRDALHKALHATEPGFLGVDSVYSDEGVVVYACAPEGELYMYSREYELDDEGGVKFTGDREKVERVTRFEIVGAAGEPFGGKKAPPFGKKEDGDAPKARAKRCPPGFTFVDGKCQKAARPEDRYAAGVVEKNGRYCHPTADGGEMCHATRAEAEAMLKTMRAAADCGCGGQRQETPAVTQEANMTKKELVAKILARKKAQFVAADAVVLEQLSEERLKALAEETPPEPEPTPEPEPVPETPEQRREKFLSENPDVKDIIDAHKQRAASRRQELITAMKTTKQDAYTEDELRAMPLEALEKLARVAAGVVKPDYSGAGAPRAAVGDEKVPPPPIDMVARIAEKAKKSA